MESAMPPLDPNTPLGGAVVVLVTVIVAVALRQVLVGGGVPTTPRDWALYLLVFPGLLLGAMVGVVWWVVGRPVSWVAGFVWGSLAEGFNLGRGADE